MKPIAFTQIHLIINTINSTLYTKELSSFIKIVAKHKTLFIYTHIFIKITR
jgi:hypothetical protein